MGMIMVVGIVAKNGILMLDAVEEHLMPATRCMRR
jgi:multidrug efflux pump subunit AcrB